MKLDQSSGYIQNVLILYSLGILELYSAKISKCAQFFAHWLHWSHMAGHIQNVLRMYPLGISVSHSGVYSQHLITGHIGVTCCLCSQCFHNVPSGYLGPCPQCLSCPKQLITTILKKKEKEKTGQSYKPSKCDSIQSQNINWKSPIFWPMIDQAAKEQVGKSNLSEIIRTLQSR